MFTFKTVTINNRIFQCGEKVYFIEEYTKHFLWFPYKSEKFIWYTITYINENGEVTYTRNDNNEILVKPYPFDDINVYEFDYLIHNLQDYEVGERFLIIPAKLDTHGKVKQTELTLVNLNKELIEMELMEISVDGKALKLNYPLGDNKPFWVPSEMEFIVAAYLHKK